MIDLQGLMFGVEGRFDVLEFESLTDLKSLFQDVDMTLRKDQADESDLADTDGQLLVIK